MFDCASCVLSPLYPISPIITAPYTQTLVTNSWGRSMVNRTASYFLCHVPIHTEPTYPTERVRHYDQAEVQVCTCTCTHAACLGTIHIYTYTCTHAACLGTIHIYTCTCTHAAGLGTIHIYTYTCRRTWTQCRVHIYAHQSCIVVSLRQVLHRQT